MLVAYFVELMNQDAERTALNQRDEELSKQLAKFVDGHTNTTTMMGHNNGGPSVALWNHNV